MGLGIAGPEAFAKELGFVLRAETGGEGGKQGSGESRLLVNLAAVRRVDCGGPGRKPGAWSEGCPGGPGTRWWWSGRGNGTAEPIGRQQRMPVLYFLGVFNLRIRSGRHCFDLQRRVRDRAATKRSRHLCTPAGCA